jgi:hypothetical protein
VTEDHTLILVADIADLALARQLAVEAGGQAQAATVQYGQREFVDANSSNSVGHSISGMARLTPHRRCDCAAEMAECVESTEPGDPKGHEDRPDQDQGQ